MADKKQVSERVAVIKALALPGEKQTTLLADVKAIQSEMEPEAFRAFAAGCANVAGLELIPAE